jgi:hypothetical protein
MKAQFLLYVDVETAPQFIVVTEEYHLTSFLRTASAVFSKTVNTVQHARKRVILIPGIP